MNVNTIIHACERRIWYVEKYLAPDLRRQTGCEPMIYNDKNLDGCLISFLKSCMLIAENQPVEEGLWHFQDDVLVCENFAERAKKLQRENIVVNGFVGNTVGQVNKKCIGLQAVNNYWFSFPCIYIPNRYIHGFLNWFFEKCISKGLYSKQVQANKYDDFLFWKYMRERNKNDYVFNACPNLVQHIDDIIGGSTTGNKRTKACKSLYFQDNAKEEMIKHKIESGVPDDAI